MWDPPNAKKRKNNQEYRKTTRLSFATLVLLRSNMASECFFTTLYYLNTKILSSLARLKAVLSL
jgi:hypothetical protein